MKNRIAKIIFIIALLSLVFGLVACAGDSIKGTYYEYYDGVKNENNYITLGKDSWTDSDGESGRLEVKDGVVYCYYNFFGSEEVLLFGTVSDGIFKFTFGDKMPSGELIYSNRYSDKSNAEYKDSRNYFGNSNPSNPTEPNNPTDPQPPQKATYTVSFDSCGGTSVAAKTVEEGAKLAAPNQPTRTMFVFAGWYKDSGYNKVWDFATDTVEENITLYARWTAEEVRVTSVNGAEINGTDIFMIVSNSIDEVDLTDKVILNNNTATWKLYYDKLGQMEIPTKLAATQSGSFKDGSNLFYIVVTSADATQSKTYTLDVYKKYEVTVKVIGREQQVLSTYGVMTLETLREPLVSPNYITGYTITGYSSTGTSVGAKVSKNSAKIITLTARLSANTYTATLNADGGTISNSAKTVTYNSRASLGVPTRTGYSFDGWYLGSTQIAGSDGVCAAWTYAEDKTLRAKWTPNRYRVTVEAAPVETGNGGSVTATGVDGSGSSVLGEYGSTITLTATTNNGFTFIGWYKGETKVSSQRIYNAPVSAETTNYTAKWIKCPVTLEKNIAEAGTVSGVEGATLLGGKVTITATTNDGYTWLGWYDGEEKVSSGTSLTYEYTMTAENKTFTAKWTFYTVSTETNLSEAGSYTQYSSHKFTTGENITLTATTKNGYTWLGWFDGEEKVSTCSSLIYEYAMTAENKTFTAKWIVCPVTLEKNVSEAGSVSGVEGATAVGENVTIVANTFIGYIWQGWFEDNQLLSSAQNFIVEINETPIVYTAKWKKCTEHNSNEKCVCEKCGLAAHSPNENCVCTKCGETDHSLNIEAHGYCRHENFIYFGYYPQTIKDNEVVINSEIANNNGYYAGDDGNLYAKVTATPSSYVTTFSTGIQVKRGVDYYFKVEPLRWRILEDVNDNALIICDVTVSYSSFGNSNNYKNSEIRSWLNGKFYQTAFNALQQELIQITTVDNSVDSTGLSENDFICEDTIDKLFLPSYSEITNANYGFENDSDRIWGVIDYNVAIGADDRAWWLRSPDNSMFVRVVSTQYGLEMASNPRSNRHGIVPTLNLKLNSN